MSKYRVLLLTTFIISGCAMVYELIISAISTYLLGNSVFQYSITIGLYMFSMGLGAFLSKYIRSNQLFSFILIEILIGIIGGFSSLILFYSYIKLDIYPLTMYGVTILIGSLVGMEIPLLTRIIEADKSNLPLTLSSVFSLDYIGGLIGAVAFPLILLPQLGFFTTSFLCGTINLIAALIVLVNFRSAIDKSRTYIGVSVLLIIVMAVGSVFADKISRTIENGLYRDTVIFSEQTLYQHIVVTRYKDDVRLYLDGNIQFSTRDEYRYHESLVHIPFAQTSKHSHVLILGGGDGMAAREALKYKDVDDITLVDLDSDMTKLASTHTLFTQANENSLNNPKVTVVNEDAYRFIEENKQLFDVIIIDLPDPNNETLAKLYSNVFYRACARSLNDEGVLVTQSTSPFFASKTFWSINKTLRSEGLSTTPYHMEVPSFGDWGFNMAKKQDFTASYALPADIEMRYLNAETVETMTHFAQDEINEDVDANSLTHPVILDYYNEALKQWR